MHPQFLDHFINETVIYQANPCKGCIVHQIRLNEIKGKDKVERRGYNGRRKNTTKINPVPVSIPPATTDGDFVPAAEEEAASTVEEVIPPDEEETASRHEEDVIDDTTSTGAMRPDEERRELY